jgi:hypothetical protein
MVAQPSIEYSERVLGESSNPDRAVAGHQDGVEDGNRRREVGIFVQRWK